MLSDGTKDLIHRFSPFTPMQIYQHGFILNTKNRRDYDFILEVIHKGLLAAQNITPNGKRPNYRISGENVIKYLENIGNPS